MQVLGPLLALPSVAQTHVGERLFMDDRDVRLKARSFDKNTNYDVLGEKGEKLPTKMYFP
jgi:hypothetical protein